jgi:hypothetical protein
VRAGGQLLLVDCGRGVLQRAAAVGAGALVHTVIKKDLVASLPQQRIRDICDYHSSV